MQANIVTFGSVQNNKFEATTLAVNANMLFRFEVKAQAVREIF